MDCHEITQDKGIGFRQAVLATCHQPAMVVENGFCGVSPSLPSERSDGIIEVSDESLLLFRSEPGTSCHDRFVLFRTVSH